MVTYCMIMKNSIEKLLICSLDDSAETGREAGFITDRYLKTSRWFTPYKGKDKKNSFSVVSLKYCITVAPLRKANIFAKPLLQLRRVNIVCQYTEYQLGLDSCITVPYRDALSARIIWIS